MPLALRLQMRAAPARAADLMARYSMHRDWSGRVVPVTHADAIHALRLGFKAMIDADFKPVVLHIPPRSGRAFPYDGEPPRTARWFMGCALDVDGAPTFRVMWMDHAGISEEEAQASAETALLERLAADCNVAGVPERGRT